MTTTQPLTSSRALTPRPAATATTAVSVYGEQVTKAEMIAAAAAALPEAYRGRPGAVFLAMEFAEMHGLTLVQTMQGLTFVKGRPVVDAALQRALAQRAGYEVVPDLADDRQSCTVTVTTRSGKSHRYTYTLEDARLAGLLEKDNWRKNPGQMLIAAASRSAIRTFIPEVLLGVYESDEVDAGSDAGWPIAEAPSAPPLTVEQFAVVDSETGEIAPDDVFEADVVEAEMVDEPIRDEISSDDLRAMLRADGLGVPAIVRAAQVRWPNDEIGTVSRVAAKGRAECESLIASIVGVLS